MKDVVVPVSLLIQVDENGDIPAQIRKSLYQTNARLEAMALTKKELTAPVLVINPDVCKEFYATE